MWSRHSTVKGSELGQTSTAVENILWFNPSSPSGQSGFGSCQRSCTHLIAFCEVLSMVKKASWLCLTPWFQWNNRSLLGGDRGQIDTLSFKVQLSTSERWPGILYHRKLFNFMETIRKFRNGQGIYSVLIQKGSVSHRLIRNMKNKKILCVYLILFKKKKLRL